MPRSHRIDHENAFHHVMNRGAARQPIFFQDSDRALFLNCVEMACDVSQIEIHCYCLMENHFHLLVRSREGKLSTFLQQLSGRYTRLINNRTGRDGPLFRGRANSILIDTDAQLVNTTRYIHLNPVAAGICNTPNEWHWSSSKSYSTLSARPAWLSVETILAMFENMAPGGGYEAFLREGVDDDTVNFYGQPNWNSEG